MFPYRKYNRYPLERRRRYVFRMNHDFWQWVFIVGILVWFVVMEVMR